MTIDDLHGRLIGSFQARARWALQRVPARTTSYLRTIAHNAEVGGAGASQHLLGYALDLVPVAGATNGDLLQIGERAGLVAIDEGDHVHWHLVPVTDTTRATLKTLIATFAR